MIMTVAELKTYINTTETDARLEKKLAALELKIRKYTNNNFQDRGFRRDADVVGGLFIVEALTPFEVGDTVQISESGLNEGLYTVKEVDDSTFTVNEKTYDEKDVLVTKVEYPEDVKEGVANMLQWQLDNGDKVGVQSETLSRHSVTYFNMDGGNSAMGFPKSLLGFLNPYRRVRF